MSKSSKLTQASDRKKSFVGPMSEERKREVIAQFTDDVLSKLVGSFFDTVANEHWTKRDLSEISGINETAISHILAGRRKNLTVETIALLTRAMRTRPELVLHDTRPSGNQLPLPHGALDGSFSLNNGIERKRSALATVYETVGREKPISNLEIITTNKAEKAAYTTSMEQAQ